MQYMKNEWRPESSVCDSLVSRHRPRPGCGTNPNGADHTMSMPRHNTIDLIIRKKHYTHYSSYHLQLAAYMIHLASATVVQAKHVAFETGIK